MRTCLGTEIVLVGQSLSIMARFICLAESQQKNIVAIPDLFLGADGAPILIDMSGRLFIICSSIPSSCSSVRCGAVKYPFGCGHVQMVSALNTVHH